MEACVKVAKSSWLSFRTSSVGLSGDLRNFFVFHTLNQSRLTDIFASLLIWCHNSHWRHANADSTTGVLIASLPSWQDHKYLRPICQLLCWMPHFMDGFLFLVAEDLLKKHVNDLVFSGLLVFFAWQQELFPSREISALNLSSTAAYHFQPVTQDLLRRCAFPLAEQTAPPDIKPPRKLISFSGLLTASLIGSRPENFNLCKGKSKLIVNKSVQNGLTCE